MTPVARWPCRSVRRGAWTPRVWPGALLLHGEITGTWRRAGATIAVTPWRALSAGEREAVEAEGASLPVPDVAEPATTRWDETAVA